jgi:hypothetical protein
METSILDAVARKLELGACEQDGSIAITARDLGR